MKQHQKKINGKNKQVQLLMTSKEGSLSSEIISSYLEIYIGQKSWLKSCSIYSQISNKRMSDYKTSEISSDVLMLRWRQCRLPINIPFAYFCASFMCKIFFLLKGNKNAFLLFVCLFVEFFYVHTYFRLIPRQKWWHSWKRICAIRK